MELVAWRVPGQLDRVADVWAELLVVVVGALLLAVVVLVFVRLVIEPVIDQLEAAEDTGRGDAMDTLRERFARGEIDEDEFERRAAVLRRED